MDTIIYVYVNRNCGNIPYRINEFDMGDYRLVRVGVSSDFLRILRGEGNDLADGRDNADGSSGVGKGNFAGAKRCIKRFLGYDRRRTRAAEAFRRQQCLEEKLLRETFVQELLRDTDRSTFFSEETITVLEGRRFNGYTEEDWVMHMLKYASSHHYIFLGCVYYMPRLVLSCMKNMKSMRWILLERQYRVEEQRLVEDIYEQYGLLVEVQLMERESDFRRLRLTGRQSVTVVDFSEEDKMSGADLPEKSIWLDMRASEVKRQRMEDREQKILYFSLKKEWKQPQKALFYLDTTHKNRYNT